MEGCAHCHNDALIIANNGFDIFISSVSDNRPYLHIYRPLLSAVCPSYVCVDGATHPVSVSCWVWCGDMFGGGSWSACTGTQIQPGGWGHKGVGGVCWSCLVFRG
jgi:hypothetical protein